MPLCSPEEVQSTWNSRPTSTVYCKSEASVNQERFTSEGTTVEIGGGMAVLWEIPPYVNHNQADALHYATNLRSHLVMSAFAINPLSHSTGSVFC